MKRLSSTNEPPELTYFVDADLCGAPFLGVLSEARIPFESHNEHFEHGTADEDWLPTAGQNGWPVLTHDKRIYRNDFRLRTLMESGVRVFVLIGDPSKSPSGV